MPYIFVRVTYSTFYAPRNLLQNPLLVNRKSRGKFVRVRFEHKMAHLVLNRWFKQHIAWWKGQFLRRYLLEILTIKDFNSSIHGLITERLQLDESAMERTRKRKRERSRMMVQGGGEGLPRASLIALT